jgi:diguanylate cyclase (GGDEF)-like protein
MGGEEFALLLPVKTRAEALDLLEAVRQSVEQASIAVDERPITFTVSIGAVLASQRDIEALLDEADKALYQAKSTGRNRVVLLH